LVVTENGYGKRTRVSEYPVKGRGGMGVKTVQLNEARGHLIGSRVVRDGYQGLLTSTAGTVIRTPREELTGVVRAPQAETAVRMRGGSRRTRQRLRRTRGTARTRRTTRNRGAGLLQRTLPKAAPDLYNFRRGFRMRRGEGGMAVSRQVDLLEPINLAEHLDK